MFHRKQQEEVDIFSILYSTKQTCEEGKICVNEVIVRSYNVNKIFINNTLVNVSIYLIEIERQFQGDIVCQWNMSLQCFLETSNIY